MIATTRTVTCDLCGQWEAVDDLETAAQARRRLRRYGWRTPSPTERRDGVVVTDICPVHPSA